MNLDDFEHAAGEVQYSRSPQQSFLIGVTVDVVLDLTSGRLERTIEFTMYEVERLVSDIAHGTGVSQH